MSVRYYDFVKKSVKYIKKYHNKYSIHINFMTKNYWTLIFDIRILQRGKLIQSIFYPKTNPIRLHFASIR